MAEASVSTTVEGVQAAVATRIGALVTTLSFTAQASGVEVRCDRLGADAAAELRARAQLTLRAAPEPPRTVALECSSSEVWLLWEDTGVERLIVDESAGLVEGALRAMEQRLNRDEGRDAPPEEPTVAPRPGESLASGSDPEPTFDWNPPPPRRVMRPRPAGGVSGGLELEPRAGSLALGPRLDLGAGMGDVAVVATQILRIGTVDATYLFDTRLGCAWGAPFVARRWVGMELFAGVQGLSGVGREITTPGRRTDSTLALGVGVRSALGQTAVAPYLGVDLAWRTRTLRLDEPYELELSRWQVGVSVGIAYRAVNSARWGR